MPLTLFRGPFSYLESVFVEALATRPPGPHRRVAVVTASQPLAERLQRLLTLERGFSFFNLKFHTLHSLALEVVAADGGAVPTVINDDLFHERLVEHLLLEENLFSPDTARALAGAYRATLRDLLDAGVDAARFREYFSELEIADRGRLDRLLSLADRYRQRLEQMGVAGSADLAARATRAVEERPDVLSRYDEFFYYGFYDLNGAQSDFFSAVAQQASVRLFFPCLKGRSAWAFAERYLNLKVPWGGTEIHDGEPEPTPLSAVFEKLFEPGQTTGSPVASIRMFSVSGERDELWRVAKEILKIREGAAPPDWDEIGVVARGLEPYSAFLADVLGTHGIPWSISDGGPLLSHPQARLAMDVLTLSARTHERDALLDIVQSPALRSDSWGETRVESVRAYLNQCGPRAGLSSLLSSPPATADVPESLRPPPLPPGLRRWAERLAEAFSSTKKPWAEHARAARRTWERFIAPAGEAAPPEGSPALDVLDSLFSILDRLAEMDRFSPAVSAEEFVTAFVEALKRARRPGTGPVHGVQVLGAMDARGMRFKVLFLMGLKEGVFPRVVREDPLLSDDLRRILRDPGGYWILPKREGHDEEKLLFALSVSAAQDQLVVSYSRSGVDGRAEVPSLYLRDLARSAGLDLEKIERVARPPLARWHGVSPLLLTPPEAGLADLLEKRPVRGPLGEVAARAERLAEGSAPTAIDGRVGRPENYVRRLLARGLSPSALETLAHCPFEFFLSRLIGLRDPRPTQEEDGWTSLALGKIQHFLLERIYRRFIAEGLPDPDTAVAQTRAATRTFFSGDFWGEGGPYPLVWSATEERVERVLTQFVRSDVTRLRAEGWRPQKVEWALTAPMSVPPFFWSGRLDRVDVHGDTRRAQAIDYKNRLPQDPLADRVAAGLVHQAPAYLDLLRAQKDGGFDGVEGVRYAFLSSNESEFFSAEEWEAVRPLLDAHRRKEITRILEGEFVIHPTDGPQGHCVLCLFARACRKSHGPTRKRAERVFP